MEGEPQLSLRQLSQHTELSVSTCERIIRKDLEDSVTTEGYRNNILDVFINQLHYDELAQSRSLACKIARSYAA
jgi:AraC-like DNA-binding protein